MVWDHAALDILDGAEDIETALAFAQKRREQMFLPDFQFDDEGGLLSTGKLCTLYVQMLLCDRSPKLICTSIIFTLFFSGDVDPDDISSTGRRGDDSDDVISTTTIESEITYGSSWDLNSSGRPSSLFIVRKKSRAEPAKPL